MEDVTLMLRSAIPIDDIDRLMFGPTDGLAVVWVNVAERPDLQVLAERHEEENGYCICTWFSGNAGKSNMVVGLRVEMWKPTRTVFHLVFKVAQYVDQLSLIGQAGKIWVMPGPLPTHLVCTQEMTTQDFLQKVVAFTGQGVMIELEPHLIAELHGQLEEWKRIK